MTALVMNLSDVEVIEEKSDKDVQVREQTVFAHTGVVVVVVVVFVVVDIIYRCNHHYDPVSPSSVLV